MPSILSDNDKETVKRVVPKGSNKIFAVAVAKLYVAYPNKQRWVYTGLQGAAVLCNDLVGNTLWIKMVDVSGFNRGVLWDQEIYDPFYYNQDRTFFHSFELEDCLAGLSFVDEKEAKQFKKKMDEREKNASKATKATPFQGSGSQAAGVTTSGKSHHRFGGIGNLLHGQRSSSAPQVPPQQPQSVIPLREPPRLRDAQISPSRDRASSLDTVDPSWRGILGELLEMGITEDQIEQNSDFIKDYIEQRKASVDPIGGGADSNTNDMNENCRNKTPPPPPSALPARLESISPQNTGSTSSSKRGPAPALPPARRSRPESQSTASSHQEKSPDRSSQRKPSPPRPAYQFRAPPPLADAGKFANAPAPTLPKRNRAVSNVANPGPPPPPRPPKTPMEDEDEDEGKPKFGVTPPFQGERKSSVAPLPPPSRTPLQLAPRNAGETNERKAVPPSSTALPPLPPKTPSAPPPSSGPPLPPPLPAGRNTAVTPPPPPLPSQPRPVPNAPSSAGAPPPSPLPLPSSGAPIPPPLSSSGAPPPPPMPSAGGPPAPPLPPGRGGSAAPPLPQPGGVKEDVLAAIRASGGVGGGGLKKVSEKEKRDRSAAAVPGTAPSGGSGSGPPPVSSGGGGLGDALAAALSKRNKKVSASDDEEDDDDDWDDPPKRR